MVSIFVSTFVTILFIPVFCANESLSLYSKDLRLAIVPSLILSFVASECFHPDPLDGLPGIFNILYSGEYISK
jgi:hypothetical protein